MFGLKGNKKRNYRSNLTAGNAMGRWLRPGLAAAVFAAGAFGALGPRSAANAQELNDLLRGGVGIILQEIDRQQRINRRQQTEKPAPRARKAQEQRQPDAARSGADRATVARIQAQLAELGYDPGPVDGAMGPRTRRAIIAFQRDNGLARTGAANKATAAAVQTAYNLASRAGKPSAGAAALGPSFDCTRAATLSERAICADPRLAARDLELTRLYGDAIAGAGAARAGALRAEQQAWLTRRDRCGADASCIGMRMEERIATLAATAGVGAQASRPGGASSTALTARGASAVGSDANAEQPFAASSDYAAAVALALQDHARAYLDLGPAAVIDHKLATADPATCASLAREIEAMAADAFLARATLDRWTPEFRSALAAASAKPKRATHVLHVRSSLGPYDFASSGFPINNAPFLGAADTRLRAVRMRLAERDAEAPPCTKAGSYAIGRILQSLGESGARLNRTRLPYLEASIEPLDAKAFLPMAPAQAQALVERYRASSAAPFVNIALAVELAGPVNPFAALPARVLAVRIHDGQTGALLHEASPEPPAPQDGVAEGTIRDYALIAFRSDLDAYRRAPELNGLVLEAADNDEETCRRTRGIIRSNDQFAIRDHLAQAARRFEAALPEIEAANGPFEREFAIERPMPLGQYDFARQAFTFEWSGWIQGVVEPGAFALAGDVVTGCKVNLLGITTLAARHLARLNGGGGGGQWLNLDGLHVRHDGAPWAATLPIAEDKARAILAAGVRSVTVVARVRFGPRETQGPGPLPGKIVSVEFRSAESGETLGVVRRPDSTPQEDAAVPAQGGIQPLTPELATRMVLPLISRIDDEARVFQRLEHAVRQAQSLIASGRTPSDLPLPLSEIRDRPPAVVVSRHRDALLAALGKASLRLPMQVSLRSTTSAHYTAHDGKLKVHYGPPAAWQSQSGAKGGRIFVPAMLDFGARRAAQDRPPLFGAFVADGLFQTAFLLDKTLREDVLDLPVEEAVRRGFGGGARRDEIEAEVILDVADVRLAEAGVAIIEADLKRVVLRWKSDGAVLADFDFSTRPTQAEQQAASAPRSAAELPLSPPPPGAPMTAEITDLLHVRMLPESLDDRHYARMMLSRHSYERRLSQRGQEPEWGRFFVAADGRLDADAVAAQLPAFKAWIMARAKAVPTRLTVNLPLHAGISSFIRRGDSGAQLKSACRDMARRHQAETRKAEAGAMLCDYLRKAWYVPDDHLFLEADAPLRGRADAVSAARPPRRVRRRFLLQEHGGRDEVRRPRRNRRIRTGHHADRSRPA
ncbi:peptidoglycan-binding protein [Oceanicella actignis]|uniref:Putative peptidoglycan binding domain-containing protein n=1 Tax=Oceanicella actignis TaxID=1189325 RepID=A0A1M7T7L7_9RHOB|nr:peptidoglycan-binding protein [Oceanicella actignis]SET48239.1 Putative peptidoglycan binding domain-containing protein [Oceanicella actignis]SHN66716.1 Putative peptidoglycan binding domain-containing protein [Oceanicella actignis]